MAPAPPFSSYLQPTTRPLSQPHSRWEGHSHPSSPTDNQGQWTGNGDLPEGKHGRAQLPGHQRGYGPQPGPTGAQDAECRQDQESPLRCSVACKFFYTVAFFKKSGRPQAVQHCPLASPHKATAASGPLDTPGARRPGSLKTAHPRPPLQASPAPQGQGGFQLSNGRGKTGEGQRGHVVCCYQQGALGPRAGGGYLDTRLAEPFPAVTPGCPPRAPTLLPGGRGRAGPGAGHRRRRAARCLISLWAAPPRAPTSPCQPWAGSRRVPDRVGFLKETGSLPEPENPPPLAEKKPLKDNRGNNRAAGPLRSGGGGTDRPRL